MLPTLNEAAVSAATTQGRRPTVVAAPAAPSPELPDRPLRIPVILNGQSGPS